MEEVKQISSIHNPLVRKVISLRVKSRERKASQRFVLEGERELLLALKGGYLLEVLLFCPEIVPPGKVKELRRQMNSNIELLGVSREVYSKLAYRGNTQGLMAIGQCKSHTLDDLTITGKNPLYLVAEAPEKPGNIGALLRTADAAALDAVIIANPKTDLYNPNIIRSSVGCLFTTQIAVGGTAEVITYLKKSDCRMFCAALTASLAYTEVNYTNASALIVGTEAQGLSQQWLREADQNIIIPMEGHIDSMNVSVSAAILIFEAIRQRKAGV